MSAKKHRRKSAPKRRKQRGGVNDYSACLLAVCFMLLGIPIAASMDHPACTGQCVRTPAEQRAAATTPVALEREDGFDTAVEVVLTNEGGYVERDGNTAKPAIYGINAKWHREAFTKAKRLADTRGESAGKEYAKAFYKREFWDRYRLSALPASTQAVVLDGVVNHASAFAKRLVQAAERGATPKELLRMRWREYHRLAGAAPKEYAHHLPGWMNRLEAVARAVAII